MSTTDQTKHTGTTTDRVKASQSLTWDQATFTWDQANKSTWDDPYQFTEATKHTASTTDQTKHS